MHIAQRTYDDLSKCADAVPSKHWVCRGPTRQEQERAQCAVHLRRGAVGAGHVDGLGAAVVAGLDVELDLLTLAQAAVAVGLDAGLRGCGQICIRYTALLLATRSA